MGKGPRCPKEGMNKGAWTAIEDQILKDYVKVHGEGKWGSIPKRAGLKRCGKSCRLRWLNYLRPSIKRGNITPDEDDLIIRLHNLLGNRWSLIAGRLPGRTDNEIKNYWNSNLSKRAKGLKQPVTKSITGEKKAPVVIAGVFQTKGDSSTTSILVTPQAHHLPDRYQYDVTNNVKTLAPTAVPSQITSDGTGSLTSKEEETPSSSELMVDFDHHIGDMSISELLGTDFTSATGSFGQASLASEYWSTGVDPFLANVDADSGFLASLMGSSVEWMI